MKGPKAAVMFNAPKRCGEPGCLTDVYTMMRQEESWDVGGWAYDWRTWLMKLRMAMKDVFVLLLARESRKDVAAETGVSNVSYSSSRS